MVFALPAGSAGEHLCSRSGGAHAVDVKAGPGEQADRVDSPGVAANGKWRRQSNARTTVATAGTANHSVVSSCRAASCLNATSSAVSIAPTAISKSKP
jgi:hypothetical protein